MKLRHDPEYLEGLNREINGFALRQEIWVLPGEGISRRAFEESWKRTAGGLEL